MGLKRVWLGWLGELGALGASLVLGGCVGPANRESTGREALGDVGAPVLSSEFALSQPSYIERPTQCPTAAFGTRVHAISHTESQEVAVTFFDRDGNELDPFGTYVGQFRGINSGSCAPIVFTGTNFVTVWDDEGELRCARITEDGTVLDPGGVATGLTGWAVEGLATDGSHVLVSASGNGAVALLGVDCSAASSSMTVPTTAGAKRWTINAASGARNASGGVAFDGTRYWLIYSETKLGVADRLAVQAVSTAGVPSATDVTLASAPFLRGASDIPQPALFGSIAAGGGKTAVGYSFQPHASSSYDVHYAELTGAGSATGDQTLLTGMQNFPAPVIGFAGNGFLLAPQISSIGTSATILLERLTNGSILTNTLTELVGLDTVSFSNDGGRLLLARSWAAASSGRLIGPDLQPLAENTPLLERVAPEQLATAANTQQMLLAVYNDADYAVFATRVAHDGTLLDAQPLALTGVFSSNLSPSTVASNGTDFLVLGPGGYAQTVDHVTGAAGDSTFVYEPSRIVSTVATVASDGAGYLVVWPSIGIVFGATQQWELTVQAARLAADGSVLAQFLVRDFTIPGSPNNDGDIPSGNAAVTYDGSSYIVASEFSPNGTRGGFDMTTAGPIVLHRVSSAGDVGLEVDTGWTGTLQTVTAGDNQALVTFTNGTNAVNGTSLYAGRTDTSLSALDHDAFLVSNTVSSHGVDHRTSAAWDGSAYWVSWEDDRVSESATDDFYAARVTPGGSVLDPSGIVVSAGVAPPDQPSSVGIGGGSLVSTPGQALAVYSRFDPARDKFGWVLHGRWLSSEPGASGAGGSGSGSGGVASGVGGSTGGANNGGVENGGAEDGGAENGGMENAGAGGSSSPAGSGGSSTSAGGAPSTSASGGVSNHGGAAGRPSATAGTGAIAGGGGSSGHAGSAGGSGRAGAWAAGSAGRSASNPGGSDDGCGCRVPRRDEGTGRAALLLVVFGIPLLRRRQRTKTAPTQRDEVAGQLLR